MAEPKTIEMSWVHTMGSAESKIASAALSSLARGPRRFAAYRGSPGSYAAVLASGSDSIRGFSHVLGMGGRLVVGVHEGDGPWQIGIAPPGETPGVYVDRQRRWPLVVMPLGQGATRAFIAHVQTHTPGLRLYRATTLGVDAAGLPTLVENLPGFNLSDFGDQHEVKVVERPAE